MSTPWSPSTPIEDHFRQLNVAQKFSIKASDHISDKVYIRIGLKLIKEAEILVDIRVESGRCFQAPLA